MCIDLDQQSVVQWNSVYQNMSESLKKNYGSPVQTVLI